MQQNQEEVKIKKFHGLGSQVAKAVGCTPDYARRVLNGEFEGRRNTKTVRLILEKARAITQSIETK